jgi:hypothetical protein
MYEIHPGVRAKASLDNYCNGGGRFRQCTNADFIACLDDDVSFSRQLNRRGLAASSLIASFPKQREPLAPALVGRAMLGPEELPTGQGTDQGTRGLVCVNSI